MPQTAGESPVKVRDPASTATSRGIDCSHVLTGGRHYPHKSCRDRHAVRRAFVPVFRAAPDFLRACATGFLVLAMVGFLVLAAAGFVAFATASTGAGNSSLGGF